MALKPEPFLQTLEDDSSEDVQCTVHSGDGSREQLALSSASWSECSLRFATTAESDRICCLTWCRRFRKSRFCWALWDRFCDRMHLPVSGWRLRTRFLTDGWPLPGLPVTLPLDPLPWGLMPFERLESV